MKRRPSPTQLDAQHSLQGLAEAFAALDSAAAVTAFLRDLCTPAELEAMADRWQVVPHLLRGESYREIHDCTGVSVTTIGRVARCLSEGQGYQAAVHALDLPAAARR